MLPLWSTRQRRDLVPPGFVLLTHSVRAVIPLSLRSARREPDLKRTRAAAQPCAQNGCAQRGTRAPVAPRDAVAASGAGASWLVVEHWQPHAHAHPNRARRDPEHARAKEHHGQFAARLELAAPPVRRQLRRYDAAPSRQWRILLPHWLRRPPVLTLAIRLSLLAYWADGPCTLVAGDHVKAFSH